MSVEAAVAITLAMGQKSTSSLLKMRLNSSSVCLVAGRCDHRINFCVVECDRHKVCKAGVSSSKKTGPLSWRWLCFSLCGIQN